LVRIYRRLDPQPRTILVAKRNTIRDQDSALGRMKIALVRRGLRRVSLVIAASEKTKRLCDTVFRLRPGQVIGQSHPAVDSDRFSPHNDWGDNVPEDIRIDFVGKIGAVKGIPDLLAAFDQLEVTRPVSLHLVGRVEDDGFEEELAGRPRLHVHESIDNMALADFYKRLHLFVMPSCILPDHEEHDGRAVLEAMSSGLHAS
jgi:glycosyltransferase involved in cell wall biosynthesis